MNRHGRREEGDQQRWHADQRPMTGQNAVDLVDNPKARVGVLDVIGQGAGAHGRRVYRLVSRAHVTPAGLRCAANDAQSVRRP